MQKQKYFKITFLPRTPGNVHLHVHNLVLLPKTTIHKTPMSSECPFGCSNFILLHKTPLHETPMSIECPLNVHFEFSMASECPFGCSESCLIT